ncbi:hypothetical protein B0T16DRAFT_387028 [Cercophora newfieldiana]|uniref:Uncharacterized protein n=1 Tax=Cercophora newfieldiana TaxID=92897 RepID=A0AA39YGS2_9PEZI|nr:hypothetical protein B0T16DRAFT_387028 [Cercophora newfieldiana]
MGNPNARSQNQIARTLQSQVRPRGLRGWEDRFQAGWIRSFIVNDENLLALLPASIRSCIPVATEARARISSAINFPVLPLVTEGPWRCTEVDARQSFNSIDRVVRVRDLGCPFTCENGTAMEEVTLAHIGRCTRPPPSGFEALCPFKPSGFTHSPTAYLKRDQVGTSGRNCLPFSGISWPSIEALGRQPSPGAIRLTNT